MDDRLVNAFVEPLQNVLSTMAAVEAVPREAGVGRDATACGDVTGVIDLTGRQVSGYFALTFSTSAILGIMERVLGEQADRIDNEARDMVGEFTNMVTGGAKKLLGELGYEFDMSVPTVVDARDARRRPPDSETAIIPFSTDCGEMCMELSLN